MNQIHPTAIIEDGAQLGDDNIIGPYCVIGPEVKLGNHCHLRSHVVMEGRAEIGDHNTFYQFSAIGFAPQDMKYRQEDTLLKIGDNNTFRENVSVHRGTVTGIGHTTIGNNNLFMGYVHIAHDCIIGNHVILANYTGLSGHVTLEDYVTLGGQNGVIQFVRVGAHGYYGAGTMIDRNLPPYTTGYGNRVQVKGINIVGLKRRGFSRDAINAVMESHKIFFRSGKREQDALDEIASAYGHFPEVKAFVDYFAKTKESH